MRVMRNEKGNKTGLCELIDALPFGLRMVEVGSFAGESAEIFAQSGKFTCVFCVDHWLDLKDRDYIEAERKFDEMSLRCFPIVLKIKKESGEAAKEFENGSVDFVYIDADHKYEWIKRDLELWEPKVRQHSWIGGHDYYYQFPGVILAVGERYKKPDHVFRDSSWMVRLP